MPTPPFAALSRIVDALKRKGMWDVARRHITEMFAVLRRMSRRGWRLIVLRA
jgi:hypothetical protein